MNFRRSIWVDSLLITAAAGIIQLLLFLYLDGGVIPFESNSFLLIYNEPRPLAQIIFDPRRTDWGLYQARELSYFFDALDARFIAWCIRAGIAHLLSLSTLFFMLGTVFLQQYAFRRHFPRLGAVAGLLSLLYVLTPCAFNPLFFRSAKPGTAFIITASLALATELLRRRRKSYAGWVGFAALLLLGCGFDRTGLLYASGCAMSGAALWILAAAGVFRVRPDGWRNLAVAALAAVLAATIYNLLLAPLLIPVLITYAGALWMLIRQLRDWRREYVALLIFLAFAEYYFFLPGPITVPRYQLPALPVLTVLAGAALCLLFEKIRKKRAERSHSPQALRS